jgi:Common central domain of tyrosinase
MRSRPSRQLVAFIALPALVVSYATFMTSGGRAALAQQEPMRTRRDIREVEHNGGELKNLRHAFFMIKKQPPMCGDPAARSEYDCWAAYHNNFADFGCRHMSDLFWPWHRYHLMEFEKKLRASDKDHPDRVADVTLPYWNWGAPASGRNFPAAVEQQLLADGEFYPEDCPDRANCMNPLWVPNRRTTTACPAIKDACIKEALDLGNWETFGGTDDVASPFEVQAHNFMHSSFIRGLMGRPQTAAQDPIYWLFHAYIDRVWDQWQKTHQSNPCDRANVPNPSRTLTLGLWPPADVRFQDVLCTADLHYQYSEGPPVVSALQNCPAVNAGCGTGPNGTPVVLTSTLAAANVDRAELRLDGLTVPYDFSYVAQVLFHPANRRYRANDAAFMTRYGATSFAAWRSDEHRTSAGHAQTMQVRLDVTRRLKEITALGEQGALSATIVFAAANREERATPLVFGKDVNLAKATLVVDQAGKQRELSLTVTK